MTSRWPQYTFCLLLFSLFSSLSSSQEWGPHNSQYSLVDDYNVSNFFDKFDFDTTRDYLKSGGFVDYLDRSNATESGLTIPSPDGHGVYIGVDHSHDIFIDKSVMTEWYNQQFGRPSVKLVSIPTYTHGLFVFDVQHMPVGCGVWPALWTTHDKDWPILGEIDIVEVFNNDPFNKMTLHTSNDSSPFTIAGDGESGVLLGNDCSASNGNGSTGCSVQDQNPLSAGDQFNRQGGGLYVLEWTSQFIRIWFFDRSSIPASISQGKPDPDTFGPAANYVEPAANFQSLENGTGLIDDHFGDHNIVINIDFCGDLAGQFWCDGNCASEGDKAACGSDHFADGSRIPKELCADFVANNPELFVDAYWEINSIKVYRQEPKPSYIGTWPTSAIEPVYSSWYRPGHVPDTLSQSSEHNVPSFENSASGHYQPQVPLPYHLGPPQPSDLYPQYPEHYEPPRGPPPGKDDYIPAQSSTAPEVAQQFGFYHPQPLQGNRAMSPTLSQGSTNIGSNVGSPQLGSSIVHDTDKEVTDMDLSERPEYRAQQRKRICGLAAKTFWILFAVLIVLLVALGAGLGAGLGTKHKSNPSKALATPSPTSTESKPTFTGKPEYSIGGVIDPAYYSKKGAFNGSGIAFAGSALKSQEKGLYTVYYQHFGGDIRYVQLSIDGTFVGGSKSEVVASDAKNATPISVVQYVVDANLPNATSTWHLFYINTDGYIRQRTWKNATSTGGLWYDGSVNGLNLKAFNAESACYYGSFYGDTEVYNFPGGSDGRSQYLQKFGMHLWYADTESTFQQYFTYENQTQWTKQDLWRGMNGHAGVGCYSWLPGTTTYAMFVNQYNVVETWWKDTDSKVSSTSEHPVNSWQNAISNAYPSTSLGYTSYFYVLKDDSTIHGYNLNFTAQSTSIIDEIVVRDGRGPVKFLNGTHMTVSAVDAGLLVFAQTVGDDVTLFVKGTTTGTGNVWTSLQLGIDKP
ncbi:hypothetical protein FKW77_009771 [Venturia effusa]|uniref:GH16 domain-containing protein n=1 Tax=Venturia effusa TaxID=50376 RepID=A0A517KXE8_9PEZI|nr:hypothetical protein FKW77_009771 [Venturia effusa]